MILRHTFVAIIIMFTQHTQCHPLLAHSKSDAPSIQRTLGSLKTVLSALKSDENGSNSAQSLIQALGG
jgi:hypothetical protein